MQILVIGSGRMGSAILKSWHPEVFKLHSITVVENNTYKRLEVKKKFKKCKVVSKLPMGWQGKYLFLAVKPQNFLEIADLIKKNSIESNFVISIMAGLKANYIKEQLKIATNVIRLMPNIATEVSEGIGCLFVKNKICKKNISEIEEMLKPMGEIVWLKKEELIDSVTALSGSGPAYFFLFLKILSKIGKELGFNDKMARLIVIQTAIGSLEMVKRERDLNKLIKYVTSKGGTTEAALNVFSSSDNNLEKIIKKAILAARKRSRELSKGFKQ